eukprot:TRINITY_DN32182_c0_g1_i2.p1 TRINITY_DN32182_c0_g1~~TRINITY_DN32182_c0_g1_i2.p1  ORF type:complete len:715 (-),score=108.92 TRINITY_DN32182_c0_g1_i2:52-2196(-)
MWSEFMWLLLLMQAGQHVKVEKEPSASFEEAIEVSADGRMTSERSTRGRQYKAYPAYDDWAATMSESMNGVSWHAKNFAEANDDSYWYLSTEAKTFEAAEARCAELGAVMGVPISTEENEFMLSTAPTSSQLWLGLKCPKGDTIKLCHQRSTWLLHYSNWQPGEPNCTDCGDGSRQELTGGVCVVRDGLLGWRSTPCTKTAQFWCKKQHANYIALGSGKCTHASMVSEDSDMTLQECKQKCASMGQCNALTYMAAGGTYNNGASGCYLYTDCSDKDPWEHELYESHRKDPPSCPLGTYINPNDDERFEVPCVPCDGGLVRRRRAQASNACTACPAGFYSLAGMDVCRACVGGQTTRRRSTMCFECTLGTYDGVAHTADEHTGAELDHTDRLLDYTTSASLESCSTCQGGYVSRRRAESCSECPPGYYDNGGTDDNCRLCHGSTRRRRAETCSDCELGYFQMAVEDGEATDECTRCDGGTVRRRRADRCTDCATGWYDSNGTETCFSPLVDREMYCSGWTAFDADRMTLEECQDRVRLECSNKQKFHYDHMQEQCGCFEQASCMYVNSQDVKIYNVGTCGADPVNDQDLCQVCTGGSTRRRRATKCERCAGGYADDGDDDDCFTCIGETRRRRARECGDCPLGRFRKDKMVGDLCADCKGGSTRRRRSELCTDCPDGYFDALELEYCVLCPSGDENRRRAPADDTTGPTECPSYV